MSPALNHPRRPFDTTAALLPTPRHPGRSLSPLHGNSSGVQAARLTLGFARWRSPQAITSDDPHVRGGLSNRNATSMEPTAHRLDLPEGPSSFGTKDPPTNVGVVTCYSLG